ncbi:adenosylcobinamide-GDP ribazoletransferase [Aquitalea magnusonii]|uniref:adenosylcobinamide-GDP ribazoletransferase n=1 Tax=Aquitalea magnusonii TaxID=332411 RepID=UPI00075018AB|nr:adenosylcobinamide-GDP ribazoletransferase [Aquitalea magnusonii]
MAIADSGHPVSHPPAHAQLRSFHPEWLAASARWFAPVGLLLGSLLWLAVWLGAQYDPWLAALLGLLLWIGITGGQAGP